MKKLFSILILSSFSYCHALADIQLDWEYTVGENDFSPIDPSKIDPEMPPELGIISIRVGPTGHTAIVMARFPYYFWDDSTGTSLEFDLEVRFAILDPQGNRIWLSEDLYPQFDGAEGIRVQILSVMPDSVTFAVSGDWTMTPTMKLFSYNSSASPQLSQLAVTGQRIAMDANDAPTMFPALQGNSFPPNTIYTVQPNFMDGYVSAGTIIRKYSLNSLSAIQPVVASESGIDGTNFVIRWQSTLNLGYQVQESTDMQTWTNVGQALIGNGAIMSWSAAIGSGNKFYRIVQL